MLRAMQPPEGARHVTLDYGAFDALTFDCYGTLIDWEAGLLGGVPAGPRRARHRCRGRGPAVRYAATRRGGGRAVPAATATCSRRGLRGVAAELGFEPTPRRSAAFGGSVVDWPAFPDSTAALAALRRALQARRHHQLRRRPVRRVERAGSASTFDWVVTAQQAGSYKPNDGNFQLRSSGSACRASGSSTSRRACSTTTSRRKRLGLSTVWIDRRHDRAGSGRDAAGRRRDA